MILMIEGITQLFQKITDTEFELSKTGHINQKQRNKLNAELREALAPIFEATGFCEVSDSEGMLQLKVDANETEVENGYLPIQVKFIIPNTKTVI